MPRAPTQKGLLEAWLERHRKPADPRKPTSPSGRETIKTPEPAPRALTQEVLLENWLKQQRESAYPRRRQAPAVARVTNAQEPPIQTPEPCLDEPKEPADRCLCDLPVDHRRNQNPKWTNDTWFEKRYGDPNYYSRVKGL